MTNKNIISKYIGVNKIPDSLAVDVDGSGLISVELHEAADAVEALPIIEAAVSKAFAKATKTAADSSKVVDTVVVYLNFYDDEGFHRGVAIHHDENDEILRAYIEALRAPKATGFWWLEVNWAVYYTPPKRPRRRRS